MKDCNDLLIAEQRISEIPLEPIDIYVAKQILQQYPGDEQGQRKGIERFAKTVNDPLTKSDLAKILASEWNKDLLDVKEFLKIADMSTMDEVLSEFKDCYKCIQEMESSVLNAEGITTGYPHFDRATGGLSLTDVFFIAARPGIGKSFVGMEIALHMAIRLRMNVVFFSLEMSAAKLYKRLVANIYGISVFELEQKIRDKTIDYSALISKIKEYFLINDNPSLGIDDVEQRVIAINNGSIFQHNKGKVQVVIIDYIQMMPKMSDFGYFEEKVMSLKPIARRQNVLMIPLCQLARSTKSWEEADISNMKGGGSLEQVGDLIWLMWKESENPSLSAIDKQQMTDSGEDNIINTKIGKARNGLADGVSRYIKLIANKRTTSVKEMNS